MSAVLTDDFTPLDRYLAEQADLTAVGRFSRHEEMDLLPKQARYYRDLIPLERPKPGQQYGFEVDLDSCTGCKACVTACHSMNGLDDDESWRSVGLLHSNSSSLAGGVSGDSGTSLAGALRAKKGGSISAPASTVAKQQTVTTGCHHCVEPACLKGCPVDAYEKDPITGIVKHLDDQCIGCGYCMLTCPYEVPRYNASRGIVRKCDMCSDRLEANEAPACVQACPNGAIKIAIVDKAMVVQRSLITRLVPGAPVSSITSPTTLYRSTRSTMVTMETADLFQLRPAEAHPPLAVMLVLTQLSVGAFVTDLGLRVAGARSWVPSDLLSSLRPANALAALLLGFVALGASVFHLGRPQYFFRAIIGIRHSWLSREIVAFGGFAGLAAVYAVALWKAPLLRGLGATLPGATVGLIGCGAVGCSVKIYTVTERLWWKASITGFKFATTMAVCGLATVCASSIVASELIGGDAPGRTAHSIVGPLAICLVVVMGLKLVWEAVFLRHTRDYGVNDMKRTALLLVGPLRGTTVARFVLGSIGGIALPLVMSSLESSAAALFLSGFGLAMVVAGELIERYQFFRAVSAPRMPGSLT